MKDFELLKQINKRETYTHTHTHTHTHTDFELLKEIGYFKETWILPCFNL